MEHEVAAAATATAVASATAQLKLTRPGPNTLSQKTLRPERDQVTVKFPCERVPPSGPDTFDKLFSRNNFEDPRALEATTMGVYDALGIGLYFTKISSGLAASFTPDRASPPTLIRIRSSVMQRRSQASSIDASRMETSHPLFLAGGAQIRIPTFRAIAPMIYLRDLGFAEIVGSSSSEF